MLVKFTPKNTSRPPTPPNRTPNSRTAPHHPCTHETHTAVTRTHPNTTHRRHPPGKRQPHKGLVARERHASARTDVNTHAHHHSCHYRSALRGRCNWCGATRGPVDGNNACDSQRNFCGGAKPGARATCRHHIRCTKVWTVTLAYLSGAPAQRKATTSDTTQGSVRDKGLGFLGWWFI